MVMEPLPRTALELIMTWDLGAEASRELPRRYRLVRGAAMALNVSRGVLYVLGVLFIAGQIAL